MKGICQCGEKVEMRADGNRLVFVSHACAKRPLTSTKGEGSGKPSGDDVPPSGRLAPTFSNAKKTTCGAGHRHASKMEAGVCDRLTREYAAEPNHYLVQQVRLPLLYIRGASGKLTYITIDFGVIRVSEQGAKLVALIEAKHPKKVSRDWKARARACELSWGMDVQEVSS